MLTYLKSHFFEDRISTPRGCCAALIKIWEGKKTFKNWCDLRQLLSLTANISGTYKEGDKI